MQTIETLQVKLQLDKQDFDDGIAKSQGKFGQFKNIVSGMAMGAGMAVANFALQAGQALVQFGADSVAAASDINETISKTNVVFEDGAAGILAWSQNAATAFGQSQQQALDAASTFAIFGKSAGLSGEDLTTFSTGFTELASDLASFNNTSPEQAIQAIGAALRGETEPMRAYGVMLDDATMRQKALELGIIDNVKNALTPQQKVLAAQALIYEQTSLAQGDFARTSDGLANQQRILDAQWADMQATIGQALLPVVLAFTSALNSLVKTVLPPLAAFIKNQLTPAMSGLAAVISNTVGPIIAALSGAFSNLGATMDKQTNGPMAYLSRWFSENMPRIQAIVDRVTKAMSAFWEAHGARISSFVDGTLGWIARLFEIQFQTILDIVTVALQLLTGDFEGAGRTLQGIVSRWWNFIRDAVTALVQNIRNAFTSIDWGGIGRAIIDGIGNGIRNAGGWLTDQARQAAWNAFEAAKDALGIHSPSQLAADEIGVPFAQGIGVGMQDALDAVTARMNGALVGMVGALSPAPAATGAGGISIQQNFYGNADPSTVRTASQDGVLAALRQRGLA